MLVHIAEQGGFQKFGLYKFLYTIALCRYQRSDLVKMDILLNGQPVDAMATIVHNQKAQRIGRELVEKLKKFIDR
jgi:translation elongation factor EF-4